MRYVDHDHRAARAAAQRCRDAAHTYDRVAGVLAVDPARVRWWGRERDDVVGCARAVADGLRGEASALRSTADLLEAAARAAERREAELAAAAEAAAAAAAVCPASPTGHSIGPSSSSRAGRARRARGPGGSSGRGAGLRAVVR